MDAFLPLIEALVAFALTMLGLATAVSAIVGAWMRALRWRAYGLRQSILLLYDRELARRPSLPASNDADDSRLGFVVDMTMSLPLEGTRTLSARRATQIKAIRDSEPVDKSTLQQRFQRWRSLRFGVDALSDQQFRVRLASSKIGEALGKDTSAEEWQAEQTRLLAAFREIGATAAETFTRHARVRTIIASFLLAVGVNVDAFNLLNTYLTDPGVRRAIIEQQTELLAGASAVANQPGTATMAADSSSSADSLAKLRGELQALEQAVQGSGLKGEATAQVTAALQRLDGTLEGISDAAAEARAASATTLQIASALTNSFPIGWDLYPICSAPQADPRCARLSRNAESRIDKGFWVNLIEAAQQGPAVFIKWALGVVLTGIMAGLGAPFWIQAVDRFLKLREQPAHIDPNTDNQPGNRVD